MEFLNAGTVRRRVGNRRQQRRGFELLDPLVVDRRRGGVFTPFHMKILSWVLQLGRRGRFYVDGKVRWGRE